MNTNLEVLKKFIGQQNQRIQDDISKQGYKDNSPYKNNPFNNIYGDSNGTPITMKGVSTPLIGIDEFGNRQHMIPGQEYFFPGSKVQEIPMAQTGGPIYVESKNDPRYKAYQDSLSLYKESIKDPSYEGNWETNGYKERFIEPYNRLAKLNGKVPKPITSKTRTIGDSYFQYKKPQQPVIVQQPILHVEGLQPMGNNQIVQDDNSPESPLQELTNIPQPAQIPKYWNVHDVNNQKFGGYDDSYKVYPDTLDSVRALPQEGWTRSITPQFQMGGSDFWKTNKKAFVDSTLTANKNLDFVKRLYDQSKGSIQIPGVPGRSTHYMADDKNRVYPTVVNKNGKLTYLSDPDEAWDYANDNKEYIDFKTPEQASWFANSPNHTTGYKLGTNVLTEIPRRQMGGAGMMYADRNYQTAGTVLPSVRSLINDTMNRKIQSKGEEVNVVQKDNTKTITSKLDKQLTPEQIEQRRVQQLIDKQGTIRESTPQSTSSRLKEIALNPLTAFGYAARNQDLPENFSRGERNSLDMATDIINPAFYLNQGNEAGNNIGSSVSNIAQGNYPAAYRDIKNAGMNTLNALPLVTEYKTIEQGLNAGKNFINSKRVLPIVGDYKVPTIAESIGNYKPYVAEAEQGLEPYFSRIGESQIGEYIPHQEDEYIKWFNEQKNKSNPTIPVQDKRSMLRGSSIININDVAPAKFNSEIDWGKWNKEIPDNPQLMKEYNAIEQTSKANGSWMKNPDGSPFVGSNPTREELLQHGVDMTPEEAIKAQFINQNSKNFKKAFGNSKLVNPNGSPTMVYHGSPEQFDSFEKFQLTDQGFHGKGIYTTPKKNYAQKYAGDISNKNPTPTLYQLYGNITNPANSSDISQSLYEFNKGTNVEKNLLNYDAAVDNLNYKIGEENFPIHRAREIVFPKSNQVKSAIGNNGMFDMTNPNIYKAVVPGAIGLGAAATMQQKKTGGSIQTKQKKALSWLSS